jgi:hypothetical protein
MASHGANGFKAVALTSGGGEPSSESLESREASWGNGFSRPPAQRGEPDRTAPARIMPWGLAEGESLATVHAKKGNRLCASLR